jgi:hypothetical protein
MKNSTMTPSLKNSLSDIPTAELLKTYRARRKANPHRYYVPNGKVEEYNRAPTRLVRLAPEVLIRSVYQEKLIEHY